MKTVTKVVLVTLLTVGLLTAVVFAGGNGGIKPMGDPPSGFNVEDLEIVA